MSLSPFDVCRHCQQIQNLHYPGTSACDHFEKAERDYSTMVRDLMAAAHEGDVEPLPEPNVHVGNRPTHAAPLFIQLRLERRVAEHAAMWWKVLDWSKKNSGFATRELGEYVVQLIKDGGR